MNLPLNIKHLRKLDGLNQTELGKVLGLTRSQIASYEQGVAEPSLCSLVKMAKYFNVSLNTLVI